VLLVSLVSTSTPAKCSFATRTGASESSSARRVDYARRFAAHAGLLGLDLAWAFAQVVWADNDGVVLSELQPGSDAMQGSPQRRPP